MIMSSFSPSTSFASPPNQQATQRQLQQQAALPLPLPLLSPPLLRHAIGTTVTPGDRLGNASTTAAAGAASNNNKVTLIAGNGTYIRKGQLYASLLGTLCANNPVNDDDDAGGGEEQLLLGSSNRERIIIISIRQQPPPFFKTATTTSSSTIRCPKVNMIILGRISRVILPTHAMVDIVAIVPPLEDTTATTNLRHPASSPPFIIPLREPFSGILRQQDLRPKSSLEVRIDDCYRPGDVVLARIHANGAERDFILSTAEAELGVIQAICERSGATMHPVSWKEMQCPMTLAKERRKVAKPRKAR